MSVRRVSKSRRSLLKTVPAVITSIAVPTPVALAETLAQMPPGPTPDIITADGLGAAQHIIGVDLPLSERESARSIVIRNRDNYEAIRRVNVPSETEPAFAFRPPRPARSAPSTPPSRATAAAALPRKYSSIGELPFEPVATLATLIAARQVTSIDLTRMYLERLKKHDATLFCVVTLTEDLALEQASEADRELRAGRYRGPLHGIPYGIKDLFATKGIPTTWGAQPYAQQMFDYDATAVERLRAAGAVLVAKLATGELAIGDLWFRARTRNPWNPERGSGGSSAGPHRRRRPGSWGLPSGLKQAARRDLRFCGCVSRTVEQRKRDDHEPHRPSGGGVAHRLRRRDASRPDVDWKVLG